MTIQVLHAVPYTYEPDENTQYKSVGLIDPPEGLTGMVARLEYAFAATQNIEGNCWSENCCRSTSIGDRMWIDNELWQVYPTGWGRVPNA